PEVPDLDAVGPVAVDDREVIAVLDGRDHPLRSIAVPVVPAVLAGAAGVVDGRLLLEGRRAWDADQPLRIGLVDPSLLAFRCVDGDLGAGDRIAGRQAPAPTPPPPRA